MYKIVFWMAFLLYCCLTQDCIASWSQEPMGDDVGIFLEVLCQAFDIAPEMCTCVHLGSLNLTTEDGAPITDGCERLRNISKDSTGEKILLYYGKVSRPYAAITVAAWVASLVGNGLVFAVTLSRRFDVCDFKRVTTFLAVCDMVFSCLECFRVIPVFWTSTFVYGTFACKLTNGGTALGANIAIGMIFIISLERYFGIVHPMTSFMTRRKVNVLLVTNILMALVAVLPLFIYSTVDREAHHCRVAWPRDLGRSDSLAFNSFQFSFYILLPIALISFLYASIVVALSRTVSQADSVLPTHQRRRRLAENKRAMIVMLAVVFAFVTLVAPYRFVQLYFDVAGARKDAKEIWGINRSLYYGLSYTRLLYPLHVAVNPLIYCAVDSRWRKDVRRLLCSVVMETRAPKQSVSLRTTVSNASSYRSVLQSSMVLGSTRSRSNGQLSGSPCLSESSRRF